MRDIWLISDTHFCHERILGFVDDGDNLIRPGFADVEAMNEHMVERWNSVVKDGDLVYHMGDVYFGPQEFALYYLKQLKGRKRLIIGNHDDGKDTVLHKMFQKISMWRNFREFNVLLTHVPVHPATLGVRGCEYNAHGHIHQNTLGDEKYLNMCVEHHDYTPQHIEDVMKGKME